MSILACRLATTLGLAGILKHNYQAVANCTAAKMSSDNVSCNLTIDQIPNWTQYFSKYKSVIQCLLAKDEGTTLNTEPVETNPVINDKVSLCQSSITDLEIDAIVNAANKSLLGGGGVDGAIHRIAGSKLYDECKTLGGCATGDAKITQGYRLPAKHVIHTVGPRGEKPDLLESCYINSLNLALQNNIRTIAFPCISTGIYDYPQKAAAKVALGTVRKFLESNPESMDRIIFCVFLDSDLTIYQTLMTEFFPLANEPAQPTAKF